MVKRKSARKKAATRTVYRTKTAKARSHRARSGTTAIPGAMATAALLAVNVTPIKAAYNYITNNGSAKTAEMPQRAVAIVTGPAKNWSGMTRAKFINSNQLMTDAAALAGGYVLGEVVKKYAPGVIKRPLGKIAKKVPKVI